MFELGLKNAARVLERAKKRGLLNEYALIGGLAVSRWGRPRATGDIDIAIKAASENLESLAKIVRGRHHEAAPGDPLLGVINFETDKKDNVPVQLVLFPKRIEDKVFANVSRVKIGSSQIPIVDWRGLVFLKLYAGGIYDLKDAAEILETVSPSRTELKSLFNDAKIIRSDKRLRKLCEGIGLALPK